MLSFVYDVADLYKTEVTVPIAFRAVAEGTEGLESRVRRACRDAFLAGRVLQRIVPDMVYALGGERRGAVGEEEAARGTDFDTDAALPGGSGIRRPARRRAE